MATRKKKTKRQIASQLARIEASIKARDDRFPNLPRSKYNLSQQDGYVRMHPNAFNSMRGVDALIKHGDNQEKKRLSQARKAAERLMSNASNGG